MLPAIRRSISTQVSTARWVFPRTGGKFVGVIGTGPLSLLLDPKPERFLTSAYPLVTYATRILRKWAAKTILEALTPRNYPGASESRTHGPSENPVLYH